jgi:hypothetical protein
MSVSTAPVELTATLLEELTIQAQIFALNEQALLSNVIDDGLPVTANFLANQVLYGKILGVNTVQGATTLALALINVPLQTVNLLKLAVTDPAAFPLALVNAAEALLVDLPIAVATPIVNAVVDVAGLAIENGVDVVQALGATAPALALSLLAGPVNVGITAADGTFDVLRTLVTDPGHVPAEFKGAVVDTQQAVFDAILAPQQAAVAVRSAVATALEQGNYTPAVMKAGLAAADTDTVVTKTTKRPLQRITSAVSGQSAKTGDQAKADAPASTSTKTSADRPGRKSIQKAKDHVRKAVGGKASAHHAAD